MYVYLNLHAYLYLCMSLRFAVCVFCAWICMCICIGVCLRVLLFAIVFVIGFFCVCICMCICLCVSLSIFELACACVIAGVSFLVCLSHCFYCTVL